MMQHRFEIGQLVTAYLMGVPSGPYQISRLLPPIEGKPQYWARSADDHHERALPESALLATEAVARPEKQKERHR